ncbi:MAG TPA: SLBB domain-containing protein [Gemmatimonas sp.]|nr:SLBB domain-containing protein [Gemmatimonas sp.]
MVHSHLLRSALLSLVAALPCVTEAQGQSVYETSIRALAGRRELTALADSLQREIARPGISDGRRRGMQRDLEEQRQRLAIGDLSPGDRILLRVYFDVPGQDSSSARRDTVIVSSESTIRVAGLSPISMRGVLRSEVESHLLGQISAVIRNARVSAVPLVSMGILGAVTRPGYFFIPVTSSVTEAIMTAGGPLPDANPNGLVFQRGGRERWNRATMTAASQQQVTLASLGAHNGDVLLVNKNPTPIDRGFVIGALGFVLQSVLIISQLGND